MVVVEAIPVDEGRDAEEGREGGDRQEAEMHAVPAGGTGDPDEEVGARDVAGAHDEGRHRRTDLPGPPVAGVVREQVQQREGHEQERDDEHPQRSRLGEHAIVASRRHLRATSAVLGVGEVEAGAGVPLRALVAVRGDAAGVLEHARHVQQVPGRERRVAVGEVVLGPA